MAIKRTLTGAVPFVLDGKVVIWNLDDEVRRRY